MYDMTRDTSKSIRYHKYFRHKDHASKQGCDAALEQQRQLPRGGIQNTWLP